MSVNLFKKQDLPAMQNFFTSLIITVFLVGNPIAATADTRYVSDQLLITLRQGMSQEHKIIKMLKSDTALEVLEESDTYLKVRTDDGLEGYVLSQYVTTTVPKAKTIVALERERNHLAEQLAALRGNQGDNGRLVDELQSRVEHAEAALATSREELRLLNDQYQELLDRSQNVISLTAEREALKRQTAELASSVQSLTEKNSRLNQTGMIKWFLSGGGVLLVGWLIGRLSRKSKSGYTKLR